MTDSSSARLLSTALFTPPVDRPVPVSLNILDDVASLAYLMGSGRETVEYLIQSRSTTGASTGVSFVRSFNGDIFPIVAAAALSRAWLPTITSSTTSSSSSSSKRSFSSSSSTSSSTTTSSPAVQEITNALDDHYHTTVYHDMDNARKQRRSHCAREGCIHSYSHTVKQKKKESLSSSSTSSSGKITEVASTAPSIPSSPSLLLCSRCKRVAYCSRACQETAWKEGGHKRDCKGFHELEETENAFRAGVSVCRAHHYEFSATIVHYFLTRGPGILVINCENWLAFQSMYTSKGTPQAVSTENSSSVGSTVFWPHGNRPASRLLRITFLPLTEINPVTRKFHRPFLDILDSRQPGNLYAEAHDMANRLATSGLILFSDDAGHIFTLKIPLLPNAMAIQSILGIQTTVTDSLHSQPPLTIHPEDIHAYSQSDLYVIDLDRPSTCNYAYPPFLFSDTPFASPFATRISYDFHTWRMLMKASNLRLQKQQLKLSPTVPHKGNDDKGKYGENDDEDTMVPVEKVSGPELLDYVKEALQKPLPEEKENEEKDQPDILWLQDDYRIARRMGLPYSLIVQTYLREQYEQMNKRTTETVHISSVSASISALSINDSITAQLKKDGLLTEPEDSKSGSNNNSSTTTTTGPSTTGFLDPKSFEKILADEKFYQEKEEYRKRIEEAKQMAMKQLVDESHIITASSSPGNVPSSYRTSGSIGILEIDPSGYDHKHGLFVGDEKAQNNLRTLRTGGENAFIDTTKNSKIISSAVSSLSDTKKKDTDVEFEIETVGTTQSTNAKDTNNNNVSYLYNPSAYQVCICPGWTSIARERLRLYQYGINEEYVPLTYQVYGTMEI